jgi:predicted small integral membrane protein|tara:strand:- start:419 stop:667 length:249 start_codon:yes stop_codon:yes gene_type:complete
MNDKQENVPPAAPIEVAGGSSNDESTGFLPIETNMFDRVFISVVIWVALSLFWFRFVEPAGFSIWISNAIALAVAALIISKG